MRNEDNDCIRYLMKEMDPSEELLMERAMMEDEDLLIEVESMRQTLKKLDKLPEMDPPSHLTDAIMAQAAEQAEKNRRSGFSTIPAFKYAVAATLALTVTAGGLWFYTGMGEENTTTQSATFASEQPVDISSLQGIETKASDASSTTAQTKEKGIEPWIDRNNVLHFEDYFGSDDNSYQALIQNATQKLQLIDQPAIGNEPVRSLQLTGSKQ